jgi:hypothetical protein
MLIITEARYGAQLPYDAKRRSDLPAFDEEQSLDVTKEIQKYVDFRGAGRMFDWSKLERDQTVEFLLGLKACPAPNAKKRLFIAFNRRGIRGHLVLKVRRDGTLEPGQKAKVDSPQLVDSKYSKYTLVSRAFGFSSPSVKIKSASYGTQMGSRFSRRIDVKSLLQTRIDQSGHNELRLNIDENLDDLFGCKLASWAGAELRILYEVPSFCLQMDVPVHKDASGLQRIGAELRIGYLRKPTTAPAPVDSGAKRREILGKKGGRTATGMMEDNGVAVDQPRPHRAHRWTGNYDIDQDRFHGKGVK